LHRERITLGELKFLAYGQDNRFEQLLSRRKGEGFQSQKDRLKG